MRMRTLVVPAVAVLLAAGVSVARADDLVVPRDYRSIDAALAEAQSGDRIVVVGGRHANVTIDKDGVTLAGRRATLAGTTTIAAASVTISDFRFASEGQVIFDGDDAVFERNKVARRTLVLVGSADRARLEGNSFGPAGVRVDSGADVILRGNRLPRNGMVQSSGAATLVEGNRLGSAKMDGPDAVVRDNRVLLSLCAHSEGVSVAGNVVGRSITVTGHDAVVRANRTNTGVAVYGDDVTVSENTVAHATAGIVVMGSRAEVVANTVRAGSFEPFADTSAWLGCPGILIEAQEPGGVVQDNDVTHVTGTGIVVHAGGVTVANNTVDGVSSGTSVSIVGDGNIVSGNTITQTRTSDSAGDGIDVAGNGNAVSDNALTGVALDAVVVAGDGNSVTGSVIEDAGGCGVLVTADATGTVVADCTVTGCSLGLANEATDTALTGTTLTDSGFADVLDLGAFAVFEGNVFETLSHDELLAPQR